MIDSLQELLIPHVGELKKSAVRGNANAKQVIALYHMYVRCPEQGARTLCECYFQDWLKKKKK